MARTIGLAGGGVLLAYAILSILTGQQIVVLGDVAQMIPPLAYAALSRTLARRCRGQVQVFWNLNAIHAVVWTIGQARLDLLRRLCRRRAGDVAERPDLLRLLHSAGGGPVRPARARSATLAVRHRAARPRVDRAVRGVRLHLLRRLDRRDRRVDAALRRQSQATARTRETCCWRCGPRGSGARRYRRRGGRCWGSTPPAWR